MIVANQTSSQQRKKRYAPENGWLFVQHVVNFSVSENTNNIDQTSIE